MLKLPQALDDLIESFGLLPGVGPRTAERYANSLLKRSPEVSRQLAKNLSDLHDRIEFCEITFALISKGQKYSEFYTDPNRDKAIVAVVAEAFDIYAIEKTNQYQGTYHVLGGLLSPLDNVSADELHINELLERIKKDKVSEIIIATNASVEGESTALYLRGLIKDKNIKVSRLAQGLPIGLDIEYADMITLGRALEGRTEL